MGLSGDAKAPAPTGRPSVATLTLEPQGTKRRREASRRASSAECPAAAPAKGARKGAASTAATSWHFRPVTMGLRVTWREPEIIAWTLRALISAWESTTGSSSSSSSTTHASSSSSNEESSSASLAVAERGSDSESDMTSTTREVGTPPRIEMEARRERAGARAYRAAKRLDARGEATRETTRRLRDRDEAARCRRARVPRNAGTPLPRGPWAVTTNFKLDYDVGA